MSDLRRMFCAHCKQTFFSDDLEQCSACGKRGGMADMADLNSVAAAMRAVGGRQAPRAPVPDSGWGAVRQTLWAFRLLRWLVGAAAFVVIGILLIVNPVFRADPRRLTLDDAMPGIAAIFAGVMLVVVVLALLFADRWRRRKKKLPPLPNAWPDEPSGGSGEVGNP